VLYLALAFVAYRLFIRSQRLERAAAASAERYRLLFDGANDAILVHDLDGNLMDVNEAACRQLGYSREELLTMNLTDIVVIGEGPSVRERMEMLRRDRSLVRKAVHRRKDGSLLPVEVSVRVIESGGRPLAQAFVRDLSLRKQAEARQAALMEIDRRLLLGEEAEDILPLICERVVELFRLKMAWIGLKEPDGTVRPAGAYGVEEGYLADIQVRWDETLKGKGPTGVAIRTGEPSIMPDIEHDPRYEPWRSQAQARGYRSSAAFPLRDDGQILGALNVYAAQENAFDEETVRQLTGFAQQATIALMAARSRQALAASEARYRTLAEQSLVGVYLIQDGRFRYVNPALAKAFGYIPDELIDQLGPNDLTAPEDRAVVAENLRRRVEGEVPSLHYTFKGLRKDGTRFDVEVFGTAVEYQGRPAVLGTLLDITERKRAENERMRRARQLQLVNEIGRALMALDERETLLERVAELVSKTFGYYATTLLMYDEQENCLKVAAGRGYSHVTAVPEPFSGGAATPIGYVVPLGKGMCGYAAQSRRPQLAADVSVDPHFFPYEGLPKTRSELSVPIVAGDRLLGVLDIQEREVGALDEADQQTMEAVAAQVAIALENARLYADQQRRVRELEALAEVDRALLTVTESPTEVLEMICRHAAAILNAPKAFATLVMAGEEEPGLIASHGLVDAEALARELRQVQQAGYFRLSQFPAEGYVAISDVSPEEGRLMSKALEREGFRSLLHMLLAVGRKPIGTLAVADDVPRSWTAGDMETLRSFASQAALAIERTQLYGQIRRQVRDLELFNRIIVAATSKLDERSVLNIICAEMARAYGVPHAVAALANPEATEVTVVAECIEGDEPGVLGEVIPISDSSLIKYLAEDRTAVSIADIRTDERAIPFRRIAELLETVSLLLIPLTVRGQVAGALGLGTTERREFTEDEIMLANNIAAQTSQALENARLFQELQETLHKLHAAQADSLRTARFQALGQMASGVVHDFNNILTSVLGYADLLLRDPDLSVRNRDFAERIRRAGINARDSINRLREFYRPRDEGEPREPTDLCELVRETLDLTEPRWKDLPQQRGVTVEVVTELTPMEFVLVNTEEIRELLVNLIFNAVDAMPDGGTLTVRAYPDDGQAVLEVVDTGIGMSEEVQSHLFEPFFTTKGERGTGLGLAMVHGAVRRHNGSVEVESAPGQGSLFRVRLPVEGEFHEAGLPEPLLGTSSGRILLIDDDQSVQEAVSTMLSMMGNQVTVASSGEEGLALCRSGEYDLVITDLGMPGMSGDEVIKAVKAEWPQKPVILLTGWGTMLDLENGTPQGADAVLSKPVSYVELKMAVGEVLG
jgi:PAS domain S-box-containing protein